MNEVIDIQNLHVRYEDGDDTVHAVRGINLSISPGERVAIIGRSGSGKSTLLRVLSGLVTPDEGHVQLGDHLICPKQDPDRALYGDVGLVFQDYGLVPQLTAMQNVMCGGFHARSWFAGMGRFTGQAHRRARRLLDELGLGERLDVRASRLSGGEQQRVAIARLLFQRPKIMLLDEPVASLDIHWAEKAVGMMAEAGDDASTLVMVLHDLSMARRFADRVIYMHEGRVLFDGDPHEACCRMENQPTKIQPPSADGFVDEDFHPTPRPPAATGTECPEGYVCDAPPPCNTARPAQSETEPRPETDAQPEATVSIGPAPDDRPDTAGIGGLWGKSSFYATVALLAIGLYIWAAMGVEFSLGRLFQNLDGAVDFGSRMFPPDFSVTSTVAASLVETIQMALIGTSLAALLSLPLAVMAARNVSPRPVQAGARLILNGLRTIPSIIWGLFFVAIVGLGPFPGILALTFYATGYLGKFYYEGIESIDIGPLRSLQTVGASPLQKFRWGVFPQVLPLMLGYTLYMFEYNVRAASILGIVGAGGIGFYLYNYINNFQYDQAATALLLLLVVVTVIDMASSRLRAALQD